MPTVDLGRVQPIFRGAYDAGTTYEPLDFVTYALNTYFCIATTTGNDPTNATYWTRLAAQDFGTMATQDNDSVDIDGGTIDGVALGGTNTIADVAASLSALALSTAPTTVTAGGTANALTLTTGRSLSALSAGMWFTAQVGTTNTGAMTVAVDGLTAVMVKTVTGADTPADYIRTDMPTMFFYDGTNMIAYREVEHGSNANGHYTRYADGTQVCWIDNLTLTYAGTLYVEATWTFPAAFVDTSYGISPVPRGENDATGVNSIAGSATPGSGDMSTVASGERTASDCVLGIVRASTNFQSGDEMYVSAVATGRWF